MTDWYWIKNKTTGIEQYVAGIGGYDEAEWSITVLPREPKPYEIWNGTALVLDEVTKQRDDSVGRLNRMSVLERQKEAISIAKAQLIDDMEAVGVINPGQARSMRARNNNPHG